MQKIVWTGSRALISMSVVSLLGGCGVAAKIEARNDYRTSADQYKACLAANPAAPQNCEGLRLAMETDERKFNNMSAGTNPGSQTSHNLTILNR
ncbi:hypothetical protein [Bradyrhizobium glycinis]|uniref:hypothetical protein n=1 Tax=Bradyrhizobium glycinis TaxID=2751812 RepID=UPI0018D8CCCD|nr:hypothetical protein [Bradyrhizobium glycinis]MBH5372808.1 hypothetical protein [Bradyrhizobium glycinis]